MGTSEVDFDLKIIATFRRNLREELDEDSHEKARVAKSRYACIHSSTVIRNPPSIIAMILSQSVTWCQQHPRRWCISLQCPCPQSGQSARMAGEHGQDHSCHGSSSMVCSRMRRLERPLIPPQSSRVSDTGGHGRECTPYPMRGSSAALRKTSRVLLALTYVCLLRLLRTLCTGTSVSGTDGSWSDSDDSMVRNQWLSP